MSMSDRIEGFIKSEGSSAIAIKGKWGEGKTHFWNAIVREHAPAAAAFRPNYAYVSLFGLNSLSDLRAALSQNIRPVGKIDKHTFAALLDWNTETTKDVSKARQRIRSVFEGTKNAAWRRNTGQYLSEQGKALAGTAANTGVSIPHIGNLGPFYLAYAYSKVRKALICVDDLERRGSGLALKDVMGLISQLVTERDCSVVVILNDGTLEDADKIVWDANREKVLSGELRYQTTPEICSDYVFVEPVTRVDELAKAAVLDLGLTNVRIIERIKATCDLVFSSITFEISEKTREHIVRCLALVVYTHAGRGEGAPPIAEAKQNRYERVFSRNDGQRQQKELSQAEKSWDEQLSRYGFNFFGPMDELLLDAVERGYPNISPLCQAVKDYDAAIASAELDAEFSEAWELFHGRFTDNGADIVNQMASAFSKLVASVSSVNADSTICLMRAFERNDLADRMINDWVKARSNDRWQELAPRKIEIFEPIKDVSFKKAITDAYEAATARHLPGFEEVMDRLTTNYYVTLDDLRVLCLEPVRSYVRYFHNREGRSVGATAQCLLVLRDAADAEKAKIVRDKAVETMKRLADENATNAVRIRWKYGEFLPKADEDEDKDRADPSD